MLDIQIGQCGLCMHFGEHHPEKPELVQVWVQHAAPEDLKEECNHPRHEPLHLFVTANSGCDGFEPAVQAA